MPNNAIWFTSGLKVRGPRGGNYKIKERHLGLLMKIAAQDKDRIAQERKKQLDSLVPENIKIYSPFD